MRRVVGLLIVVLAVSSVLHARLAAGPPTGFGAFAVEQSPPVPAAFSAEDMLKVSTASVLDLTDDGQWVAVSVRRGIDNAETDNRRYGDPTYVSPARVRLLVINTESGTTQSPFADLLDLRQASWSRDGKRLAILSIVRDGAGASAAEPAVRIQIWDVARSTLTEVPRRAGARVAVNSTVEWSADDTHLLVSLRSPDRDRQARDRFKTLTEGPIIVHNGKDPFLEWDELGRANRLRSLAEIDAESGELRTFLPERRLSSYTVSRDGTFVTFLEDVTEKTDYDLIGGTDNALRMVQVAGGTPKPVADAKDIKGLQLRWSDDGRMFAYAKKGEVFVQRIDEPKPRSLTPAPAASKDAAKPAEEPPKDTPDTDAKDEKESFSVGPFALDGSKLLITSKKGWYVVDVASATRGEAIVTLKEEEEEKNPRMEALGWSRDGSSLYATYSERDRWDRGLVSIDTAKGALKPLVKDARLYSGFRIARSGQRVIFSMSDGDAPSDLYAATSTFGSLKRLTDLNPWLAERKIPKSELVTYRDADGKVLYGVLRYPVNYEKGKSYPTVFELYETFFDNGFNGRAAFLTNHGFAVFHPSVNLVVGRPGEAWIKGVTSAANRLVEMGVADAERLGVHGTSYGGYATVLLLTQTDRFKAAVNVSGKVDMVSFYTDSPRLGVRNTHAPEKSQDRIGGTLWDYPERYLLHSAVLNADRIKTPLLCITGDQDPNVPSSQSREIYYALRRLGRDVQWVRYVNGAHRPPNTVTEAIDFEQRILGWYDKYLKADPKKK